VNRFHIRQFTKAVIRTEFDCGQLELNRYIRHYATQDIKRNIARSFIATPEEQDTQLAGFYTLSAGSINCSELPESLTKKLPRYPVPIAILGRLAVDLKYQGQGLGSILLADACQRVANASKTLAVAGIVVDAKESAADFYRHFGFMSLHGVSNKLLLPITCFVD